MNMFKDGKRVANSNNEQVPFQAIKKKKRVKKIKFYGSLALVAALVVSTIAYKSGLFDGVLKKHFDFTGDEDIDAMMEMLPIDNEGIIEVTYPIVDRTLTEDKYSLPQGYIAYDIYDTGIELDIKSTTDNVIDYGTNNGLKPVGSIGIYPEYEKFLTYVEGIKESIANKDAKYTAPLELVEYEVGDLYTIPNGYELYSEDTEAISYARLAYIANDGIKVYSIPRALVNKFIGVKTEVCELIYKYEELKEQVIFAYNTYNDNTKEFMGAIDEETANHSR